MIARSIILARQSRLFDGIAISSDSAVILKVGEAHGADWLVEGPADMATDKASKFPTFRHCLIEA